MNELETTKNFSKLKEFCQIKKGELNQLKKDKDLLINTKTEIEKKYNVLLIEKQIIEDSCKEARKTGKDTLKELASNFMQYIFNDETTLNLILDTRDGLPTLEVEEVTINNGIAESILPDHDGGGINDAISSSIFMGLGLLFIEENKTLYVLDEPSKYISKGRYAQKYAECMDTLLKNMGKQVFISTHDPNFADIGDKRFYLTRDESEKITTVSEINEC